MHYKKRIVKKTSIGIIVISIIGIIILSIFIFEKPAVTGKVIEGKETVFSENLNIEKNESGTYEWSVKNPGIIKSLKATGSVSSNGSAKVYIEKDGKKFLLFDSTKQLFDVDIHVLPEYKKIFQGDEILLEVNLFNVRGFGRVDVVVEYYIKDFNGNVLATEHETLAVETQAKFTRRLLVPSDLKPGAYAAFVKVIYGESTGVSSDLFEIEAKAVKLYPIQLKDYRVILLLSGGIIILVIFAVSA